MENCARRERLAGLVLCAAAIVLPALALYAALALAPLLIVLSLAMLALLGQRCFVTLGTVRPLIALLAGLGLWGFASTLWSIFPAHSVVEALRFLGISAFGLVNLGAILAVAPAERRRIGRGLGIGFVIALTLVAIERLDTAPIMGFFHPLSGPAARDLALVHYRFDRGVGVMVLLLWAALFIATLPTWSRFVILIATAVATVEMFSSSAALALSVASVVYVIGRFLPKATAILIIAGLTAISIAVPLLTPSFAQVAQLYFNVHWIKWSGIHRLLIWRFSSDRVAERPILGWGMDASRAMPGGDTDLTTLLPPYQYPAHALALPLHPHNGALQLLLELGIPGLVLGLTIIGWITIYVAWRAPLSPARRAGALALVAASLTIGLLSYGIWQEWWQSALWLAAIFFVATGVPHTGVASGGEASAARAAPVSQA